MHANSYLLTQVTTFTTDWLYAYSGKSQQERMTGLEPALDGWKPLVLPLTLHPHVKRVALALGISAACLASGTLLEQPAGLEPTPWA